VATIGRHQGKFDKRSFIGDRDIGNPKSAKGFGPSVGRRYVAEIKRHRRLTRREIDIPVDEASGEIQVKTPI
jgi:hypothetical protein